MAEQEYPDAVGGKQKAWKSGIQSSHPFAKFAADGSSIQCIPCSDAKDFAVVIRCQYTFGDTTFTRAHCNSMAHHNAMTSHGPHAKQKWKKTINKDKQEPEKKRKWQTSLLQHYTATTTEKSRQPDIPTDNLEQHDMQKKIASKKQKSITTCEGLIPNPQEKIKYIVINRTYCVIATRSEYKWGSMGKNHTLYSTDCTGKGKSLQNLNGLLCDSCSIQRRKSWSCSIFKMLKKNYNKFVAAKDALSLPMLTESTAAALQNVITTNDSFLSDLGKSLKSICTAHLRFYTSSVKLNLPISRNLSEGTKAGPKQFMEQFATLYEENESVRKSLIPLLMEAMVAEFNGRSLYRPKLLNFYVAVQASCPKTSQLVRANLPAPGLRHLQRVVAKGRGICLIQCESADIAKHFEGILKTLEGYGAKNPCISVAIDGTAVVPILECSAALGAMVGGVYPTHFIKIPDNATQTEFKSLLFDTKVDLAKEVKVAVISFQNVPKGVPAFQILCGQPQGKNENSNFNERVMESLAERCTSGRAVLLNAATDGVSCDSSFVKTTIIKFLKGLVDYLAITDPNHNGKNFRYQAIGGSSVATIGAHVIDADLLRVAGVALRQFRIEDFASDLLVLELASVETVTAIMKLEGSEDGATMAAISLMLMFLRINLYGVNSKTLGREVRVTFIWSSMLFFTSMKGVSMITKRNIVSASIGLVFLILRSDVEHPRRLTSEPGEHQFGCMRTIQREFTVKGMLEISMRMGRKIRAMVEAGLNKFRDRQKGYSSTFNSFLSDLDGTRAEIGGSKGVDVSSAELSGGVAKTIWNEGSLRRQLETVNKMMSNFLKMLGVSDKELSPFCNPSLSADLNQALLVPYQEYVNMTAEGDNNEEDDEQQPSSNFSSKRDSLTAVQETIMFEALDEALAGDSLQKPEGEENMGMEATMTLDSELQNLFGNEDNDQHNGIVQSFGALLSLSEYDGDETWYERAPGLIIKVLKKLGMKNREQGSTTDERKYKSLRQRWFSLDGRRPKQQDDEEGSNGKEPILIERDVLVRLPIKQASKTEPEQFASYLVMGIFNKYYNKWFLITQDEAKEKPMWTENMKSSKYRLHVRMVVYNSAYGMYEYGVVDGVMGVAGSSENIYRLVNLHEIVGVEGKISEDQKPKPA
jgi:hypothetical protein